MSRSKRQGLSRRDFLRLAGLGAGIAAISAAPGGKTFLASNVGIARAAVRAQRTGTLRVGWSPLVSLDPALFGDAPDISFGVAVYDYLVTLDQKSRVQPGLAESWEISADGKEYTFKLRSGVKFNDGSAFTAADVKFTYDRLRDPKIGSAAAELYTSVTSIEVVDNTTVKFILSDPSGPFLALLADYHACILKSGVADPTSAYVGTGPFKVESVDVTDRIVLTARDDYWDSGKPKVQSLELIFSKDTASNVQALQGGQLDWMARVPFSLFTQLQSDTSITTSSIATNQFPNIRIRADRGAGQDVRVRQALRYATNRDDLNQKLYNGIATPASDTPIGPLYGDFYDSSLTTPYDPAKAKQLLTDAGHADGLTLDFYGIKGEFNNDELIQILAEQWKQAGITVNIKLVDASVYYSEQANNWLDADLAVTNWASRPDPQGYLEVLYLSTGKWNEAHWSDEEMDKLIAGTRTESDPAKRGDLFKQMQKVFIERGPSVIPFMRPGLAAHRSNVTGIEQAPDEGLTSFANAEIK